tara:strand:- start:2956 stop:3507 length:552 start_codon:yes stop_codon:yes gene_type:complete
MESRQWWEKITDRIFLKEVYKDVGRYLDFGRVLDIGVERYNSVCKELINNGNVEYWQLDPTKNYGANDGFLHCGIQDVMLKYPKQEGSFDLIFDIGVFCWNGTKFSQDDQKVYVNNILSLLKREGIWVLHGDRIEDDPEYIINFEESIYPHFELVDFMGYKKIETIECPTHGTVWDIRFLRKK